MKYSLDFYSTKLGALQKPNPVTLEENKTMHSHNACCSVQAVDASIFHYHCYILIEDIFLSKKYSTTH